MLLKIYPLRFFDKIWDSLGFYPLRTERLNSILYRLDPNILYYLFSLSLLLSNKVNCDYESSLDAS